MDLQGLITALAQNAGTASQNAQSFSDMLKQRRQFVQAAENGVIDQAQGAINNGSNGVPISPAAMDTPALSYHTDNANKTAELSQQAFGYQSQANDVLKSIADVLATAQNQKIAQGQLGLQQQELNLKYGLGDENGNAGNGKAGSSPLNSAQAVDEVIKQGGSDILGQAQDDIGKRRIAQQVLAAGGVTNYRKLFADPAAKANATAVAGTNTTLQSITRLQDRLSHSKSLQHVLNADPATKFLVKLAIKTGNQQELKMFGLNDDDVAALGDLSSLNAIGDRQLVGGRLSGYLTDRLAPSQPGLDKSASQNLKQLGILKQNITSSMKNYAKQYGYQSEHDVPGVEYVPVKLNDGRTGKVSPFEFDPSQMSLKR